MMTSGWIARSSKWIQQPLSVTWCHCRTSVVRLSTCLHLHQTLIFHRGRKSSLFVCCCFGILRRPYCASFSGKAKAESRLADFWRPFSQVIIGIMDVNRMPIAERKPVPFCCTILRLQPSLSKAIIWYNECCSSFPVTFFMQFQLQSP